MPDIPVPLVGPSNEGIHRKADSQRSINLYPHKIEREGEKARWILQGAPGLEAFASLAYEPIRGVYVFDDRLFVCANSFILEVYEDGTSVSWGTINTVSGRVVFAELAGKIILGDGTGFYELDTVADTLSPITDAPRGRHCFAFNQRIHYVESGNTVAPGQVFYSEVLDPTNIPGANFYTAENRPDGLLTGFASEDRIWLFGSDSIEIWYDTGDATTPFQRSPSGAIHAGIYAEHTALIVDNTPFWVEKDQQGRGIVRRANGYTPVQVSTEAVERFTQNATFLTAFSYQEQGHIFYVLNADEGTWVLDVKTNEWHERPWLYQATGELQRGRPEIHAFVYGKHLVSDWETGAIYEQSLDFYAHDTVPMVRQRITGHVDLGGSNVTVDEFWLDMAVGVGLITGQGSDPQVMFEYSRDGGQIWSNQFMRGIGGIGEYNKRVRINRLGSGRDWVFKVSVSDPVQVTMLGAIARVRQGRR